METKKLTAKDLMVWDWVKYKDGTFVQIARVGDISPMDAPIYCHTQLEGYFPCQLADISPIPLTAEVLEKNGIKWLMSEPSGRITYSCNEPPISCTFIPDRGWHLSAGPVGSTKLPFAEISKAYYVHELQHVIRDAKVNKEIVL